jgi:hypothetical protein
MFEKFESMSLLCKPCPKCYAKIWKNNQKVGKIGWAINQTLSLRLKHDKIGHDGPQISR